MYFYYNEAGVIFAETKLTPVSIMATTEKYTTVIELNSEQA